MNLGRRDTIAAVATPSGTGGVGVIRVSGPEAVPLVAALIGRPVAALVERTLVRGVARDEAGARLDDVLVVAMRAPRSYTGEDVAEIHGHGGAINIARLLSAVLARGARVADPGEFTRRAVEHGKLDLTEAEAVLAVIQAGSERAWRVAQAQLAGGLRDAIERLRHEVAEVLAEVEACVDFPEEGLEFLHGRDMATTVAELSARCRRLAATFEVGKLLRDGVEVALVGPVNSGKSSLFNAMLGRERSIVSAEPGTTRDYVEARTDWDGVAVTLIDTAGERASADVVEQRGISLGRDRIATVDVVLRIREAGTERADSSPGDRRSIDVVTKVDLGGRVDATELGTSAVMGRGLIELQRRVLQHVTSGQELGDEIVVTTARQHELLERAATMLAAAVTTLRRELPAEVSALELRDGANALAELVGGDVGEDVLDALFARFCIGK